MTQPAAIYHWSRNNVQDVLDYAQLEVIRYYDNIPVLRDLLASEMHRGIEDCNDGRNNPEQILTENIRAERFTVYVYRETLAGRIVSFEDPVHTASFDISQYGDPFPTILCYEVFKFISQRALPALMQSSGIYHSLYLAAPQTTESLPVPLQSPMVWPLPSAPSVSTPSVSSLSLPSIADLTQPSVEARARGYDTLSDSPSAQLDFPNGNFTLTEILTFLPQSIKSWDLIDRLVWNGAMTVTFAKVINKYRTQAKGQISNSAVLRMMQGAMKKRAPTQPRFRDWTVGNHKFIPKPLGFDPTSISVAGLCKPIDPALRNPAAIEVAARAPAVTILFRDLANGVKRMPAGDDALDLTRCVQYCADHPEEKWYYPQDYELLLSLLPYHASVPGFSTGPAPVQPHHHDIACVNRQTTSRQAQSARTTYHRKYDMSGKLVGDDDSKKYKDMDQEIDNIIGIDSQIDDYEPPKKQLGKRKLFDSDEGEDLTSFKSPAPRRSRPTLKWAPSRTEPPRRLGSCRG